MNISSGSSDPVVHFQSENIMFPQKDRFGVDISELDDVDDLRSSELMKIKGEDFNFTFSKK